MSYRLLLLLYLQAYHEITRELLNVFNPGLQRAGSGVAGTIMREFTCRLLSKHCYLAAMNY